MTNHSFLTDCIPFFQTKLNRIPSRREKQDIRRFQVKEELLKIQSTVIALLFLEWGWKRVVSLWKEKKKKKNKRNSEYP